MRLEGSHLVLAEGDEEDRVPLSAVRRVKRVLGSPVLVLQLEGEGLPRQLIVYFAEPPPLPSEQASSRRKARRNNITYLGMRNARWRGEIRGWVRAIREGAGLRRRPA